MRKKSPPVEIPYLERANPPPRPWGKKLERREKWWKEVLLPGDRHIVAEGTGASFLETQRHLEKELLQVERVTSLLL